MSLRLEDLVIIEPGNDGDIDIDVKVNELFGNEENIDTLVLNVLLLLQDTDSFFFFKTLICLF